MSGVSAVVARRAPVTAARGGDLTGTVRLLRLMLRRDRLRLPSWVLGMTAMLAYMTSEVGVLFDEQSSQSMTVFTSNPVVALVCGPGYGFEAITPARFFVGLYGVYLMIGAALMSIMTVSRHTRVEEQTGRAELVRASAVGRHAQLAAALILTAGMNTVMALAMTVAFSASMIRPDSAAASALFACGIAAAGLVFAAVAAVTSQLSAFSRAASGGAGAVLAVSFVVRGLGDMSFMQGGGLGWLSWLTPLGWSQQTAPLVLDRWWPLALSLLACAALTCAAFALQGRRDLAAGILPDRLGAARAAAWLRSPVALALRLQRSALVWWSVALLVAGVTFGVFVKPMADGADAMPAELLQLFGGAEGIVDGFLGFMGVFMSVMISVFAILAVQGLKAEEQGRRTEPVLAVAVSRARWMGAWVVVAGAGCLWLTLVCGLGTAVGAVAATGQGGLWWPALVSVVVHVPEAWVLLGAGLLLYGVAPRLVGLVWALEVYGAMLTVFGQMMGLDDAVLATSVFHRIGQYPAQEVSWGALALMTVVAAALVGAGIVGLRRRDLMTA